MTFTEKKTPSFGVNDHVYILDTEIYDDPTWIHGIVGEVGNETISIKWDDLDDPTEYELSKLPDIRFKPPQLNNMQWIKASERLPDNGKDHNLRIDEMPFSGRYLKADNGTVNSFEHFNVAGRTILNSSQFHRIYWLGESPPTANEGDAVAFHKWVIDNEYEINTRAEVLHSPEQLYQIFKNKQ